MTDKGNEQSELNHTGIGKKIIAEALDRALEQYYETPCRETFFGICGYMINVLVFDLNAVCPTELGSTGMHYKPFPVPDYGFAWIAYTGTEKNPEMKEPETYAFVPWRNIFFQAAEDRDGSGIVINPYSGHQTYVWLSPVHIRRIIQGALSKMEDAQRKFDQPSPNTSSAMNTKETEEPEDFTAKDQSVPEHQEKMADYKLPE